MSGQKWVRDSLRQVQAQLDGQVSHTTIGRLLREMGYGLKANRKQLTGTTHPDRDVQFKYIEQQIQRKSNWPAYADGNQPGLAHLLKGFAPIMREAGLTHTDIEMLLVKNPARFLAF